MVDLDPMRGLSRWWQRRPEDGLELVQLAPEGMPSATHEDRAAAALTVASSWMASSLLSGHRVTASSLIRRPPRTRSSDWR
jgi:hypothetical protein